MSKKQTYTPEQVIAALEATSGRAYMAADRLRCSAVTVYNYARRYKEVQDVFEHHKGKRLDIAESKLWEAVLNGEAWAVCFYLKTQGKQRGYVEKNITQHEGGLSMQIVEEVIDARDQPPHQTA